MELCMKQQKNPKNNDFFEIQKCGSMNRHAKYVIKKELQSKAHIANFLVSCP